jgi:transposase InsO family protein
MDEHISSSYEDLNQRPRFAVWAELKDTCKERGLIAPSYPTFCLRVRNRPTHQRELKRKGRRGGYSTEPLYLELNRTTPRHGDRPFEICHIDHTELDVELVDSQTGENLGRPWLTLLIDAFSRLILAFFLTFDRPSYRSCMMVMRDCVRQYQRLPQIIIFDGGLEFSSDYFEALLYFYESTPKKRPPSKGRFGSVCERIFGTTNTQFIHNLTGNTQLMKNNVRLATKEVNPKNRAIWTLPDLNERMGDYVNNTYANMNHPSLGQSPRDAFLAGLARGGYRENRKVYYDEEFRMMTLPTTAKGTAKVIPGRGVKINYIFYWCEGFRDGAVEGTEVQVRYDPFKRSRAYAYFQGFWHPCISGDQHIFENCSEREIMLASAELHRRKQEHGRRLNLNAAILANFLRSVGEHEQTLRLQRKRDKEAQRMQAKNAEDSSFTSKTQSILSDYTQPTMGTAITGQDEDTSYRLANNESGPDLFDTASLELYEDY